MEVIVCIDPHKASHHALAVDESEVDLARLYVRATPTQTQWLLAWAEPFEQRLWEVEGADGVDPVRFHEDIGAFRVAPGISGRTWPPIQSSKSLGSSPSSCPRSGTEFSLADEAAGMRLHALKLGDC
jgi:hypothetical protein